MPHEQSVAGCALPRRRTFWRRSLRSATSSRMVPTSSKACVAVSSAADTRASADAASSAAWHTPALHLSTTGASTSTQTQCWHVVGWVQACRLHAVCMPTRVWSTSLRPSSCSLYCCKTNRGVLNLCTSDIDPNSGTECGKIAVLCGVGAAASAHLVPLPASHVKILPEGLQLRAQRRHLPCTKPLDLPGSSSV